MSAIGFLVLLVIAIIALMLLMTKVKLNPVMSLFVVALGFGVTLGIFGTEGYSFMETLTLITTGFGNTLGSLGMPIILGAVLAMGVQDTGRRQVYRQLLHPPFPWQESGAGPRP